MKKLLAQPAITENNFDVVLNSLVSEFQDHLHIKPTIDLLEIWMELS